MRDCALRMQLGKQKPLNLDHLKLARLAKVGQFSITFFSKDFDTPVAYFALDQYDHRSDELSNNGALKLSKSNGFWRRSKNLNFGDTFGPCKAWGLAFNILKINVFHTFL